MGLAYCPLFSGSSGNAAVIGTPTTRLLIDAGLTGKAMIHEMQHTGIDPATLEGIVITHEHSDHVKGAGIMSRKFDLPIFANELTWRAMQHRIGAIADKNIRIFQTGHDFSLGDIGIYPFLIPHDAAEPVGYCFYHQKFKISQLTDLGHVPKHLIGIVEDSDLLLLESNHDVDMLHDGGYPYILKQRILSNRGHLSNHVAGDACKKLLEKGVKRFILGHLSGENNKEALAYDTVMDSLCAAGASAGEDFELYIAHRDRSADVFYLE